jgi:hypothetical protein
MNTQLQTTQSQAVVPNDVSAAALESALAGDLARLTIEDRLKYIARTCELVGLNPLTKPFDVMQFQGKTVLYANKSCAEQLRKLHGVSVDIVERKVEFGVLVVRAKATDREGRHDEALAAVPFNDKNPTEAANAMMKAETKAKRRVTFSICGLGFAADIDHEQTQTGSTVVTTEHSSASLADKINASLTAGEMAKSIPVESVPEPEAQSVAVKPAVVEAELVTTPAAAPAPAAPAARIQPSSPATSKGLPEDVVARLETILSEGGAEAQSKAIKYLLAKGKLKPMEGLDRMDNAAADFIIKNPERFRKMVTDWQPK